MSKNIDWDNLGFGYVETDYRYLTTYKDGKWDEGSLITDANVVLNECAGVFQRSKSELSLESSREMSMIFITDTRPNLLYRLTTVQ